MEGNVEKFQRYMDEHHKLVRWSIKKYVEPELKEDVVQETFMKMYEHLEYVNDENIIPWLLTVSRNIAKDYKKKGGQFLEEIESVEAVREQMETEEFEKSAEEAVVEMWETQELRMFLKKAGDLLYQKNPRWYFILVDAVLLGMSGKEIAEALGTNVANVDVMRCRARKYIKRHLGKEAAEYL